MKQLFKRLALRRSHGARRCHGREHHGGRYRFPDDTGLSTEITQQAERLLGFVEGFMTFTPEQQSAWTALSDILREQSRQLQQPENTTGQPENQDGNPTSASARLARLEQMMSSALTTLQQIRPAFEQFYATLDEKQQRAFDELVRGRRC
jgi:hypothetical protein